MCNPYAIRIVVLLLTAPLLLCCGSKEFGTDNYKAYFGGEVVNPAVRYVLFCKDAEVLDTIFLKENNTFFKSFDSLTPGLYTFRHDPEYQYVYFDKNDSLMVHVNTRDFDESVVFCGRGDQKNNFLMELYLRNEKDKSALFSVFDKNLQQYTKYIDSTRAADEKFYSAKKQEINWTDDFDVYARASIDFHYYSKKEIYPFVHRMRTGEDVIESLPRDFYAYRENMNFDNAKLSGYSPYVSYLTHMLNNLAAINYHNHFSDADIVLKTNLNKLRIADTMIKNSKVKNTILNSIAFTYLLEDQNLANNEQFLNLYHKFSTDKEKKTEIDEMGRAIKLLKPGNYLPTVDLVDTSGRQIASSSLSGQKTVLFCWTEKLDSHFRASHKKVLELRAKYPDYQFVGINFDDNNEKWLARLANYKFPGIVELRCKKFSELREKWALTRIHRTIVLNSDGTIKNAFANLFDVNFEENLKQENVNTAITIR